MRVRAIVFCVLCGFWVGSSSCSDKKTCTLIGCEDQASFTLAPEGGEWVAGAYELAVTADGVERRCAFRVPEDLPEARSVSTPCEQGLSLVIQGEVVCTEERQGYSVSQSCKLIPDRYSGSFTLSGTPATIQVVAERDGEVLSDQTLSLTYETFRPNGPDCSPVCRQVSAEIEF